MTLYSTYYASPMGKITLCSNQNALLGLWIEGQKYFGDTVKGKMQENANLPILTQSKKWLDDYFLGKNPLIKTLNLAPIGGEFRQLVWQELCEIPYGEVTTYGNIAKTVAKKMGKTSMSAQAVGGAVGRNPISIIIPCHRVVGSNRSLTGYAGGLDKKIELLTIEGVNVTSFFRPKKGSAL
ncbi:methylated-DNA--[protein]-cysteine S-methyltransferase [Orbaceae bacterium ac157xtp]